MGTKQGKTAFSYDFDDVIFNLGAISRIVGLVIEKIKPHQRPPSARATLPPVSLAIVDVKLEDVFEKISFVLHTRRNVIAGVKAHLETVVANGIAIYGNTGRPNKRPWVDMTQKALQQGAIYHYFSEIFYTPDGVKIDVSKAAVLQELQETYERVVHFEDDPRTLAFLASLFPAMTFYYVKYRTTSLLYSSKALEKYPQIHRIRRIVEVSK